MEYSQHLMDAIGAALKAGEAILKVYASDFDVETKADRSPLTLADKASHQIIKSSLKHHGLPAISEEGLDIDFEKRRQWPMMWIVDPLDGTKEFVKRNGEFTVNIALVEQQYPVMGVVFAPVPDVLYAATVELGAFKLSNASLFGEGPSASDVSGKNLSLILQNAQKITCRSSWERPYTIVGSRSHGTSELSVFVEHKRAEKGEVAFLQAGSSLKICLVAEGSADIYPRLGPTMEWDTAAGQAIAESAGGFVRTYDGGQRLCYNKPDLLNPWFVVEGEK